MAVATRKISVTVDADLVDAVQRRVGERGFSRFVSDAIAAAIDRDEERAELREWLAELEEEDGPADPELVAYYVAAIDEAGEANA
jgi:Arc/MetJ-type ribon-helix-helix transcriptional regulator